MPALAFFIGKGGVGKTTVSSAYAASFAARNPRQRVLLLSTDPAHNLADIFQTKLADSPRRLPAKGNLFLWQINAEKHFHAFLKPYRQAVLDLIESGTIFTREEIEPLLETTLPGMAEVSALIAIADLLASARYDAIVVDTAPIGHTLRMFEMPQHFARFLEFLDLAGSRDRWLAQRFGEKQGGPVTGAVLDEWRAKVDAVTAALTSQNAELYLVTSAEQFSLNEAARSARALSESVPDFAISGVVLNRAVMKKSRCPRCAAGARQTATARAFLKKTFSGLPVRLGEDSGGPLLGASALRDFGEQVFHGRLPRPVRGGAVKFPAVEPGAWPSGDAPLAFTMGKGGVGKTTVSAALGFEQRAAHPRLPVTVCSTDPAPSLDDVFAANVTAQPKAVLRDPRFRAMELDSVAEFRRWAAAMQRNIDSALTGSSRGGVHVDLSFDRRIFSSLLEIVPPGVDEIFSIFKILDLLAEGAARSSVIIDMAPTGHALELLRMPERMLMWSRLLLKSLAPHRTLPLAQDVAVQIASLGQRVRGLSAQMQSAEECSVFAVMLAEPLPDRETGRLLVGLRKLRVNVQAVFVNRVLIQAADRCARCSSARRWQAATLRTLKKRYPGRTIYLLPEMQHEIAGRAALEKFTGKLWRLS